ncbi:hypothetical protein AC578_7783 [Pseudocercospora eumusae]|uniref:Uncharacterized protein n=1 Tax=Pseudocercospora eumusae TaxID=321146 RepID=A0A139H0W4_9PEZI|nr:hypothetical protein AC578_7783 [Pseudocercospora eumusae]
MQSGRKSDDEGANKSKFYEVLDVAVGNCNMNDGVRGGERLKEENFERCWAGKLLYLTISGALGEQKSEDDDGYATGTIVNTPEDGSTNRNGNAFPDSYAVGHYQSGELVDSNVYESNTKRKLSVDGGSHEQPANTLPTTSVGPRRVRSFRFIIPSMERIGARFARMNWILT